MNQQRGRNERQKKNKVYRENTQKKRDDGKNNTGKVKTTMRERKQIINGQSKKTTREREKPRVMREG